MISWSESWKATSRFGLGPRPGEIAAIAPDPRGYVAAQIAAADPVIETPKELASDTILTQFLAFQRESRMLRQALKRIGVDNAPAAMREELDTGRKAFTDYSVGIYRGDVAIRAAKALATDEPFVERLVIFWSNHFAVSAKGRGRPFAGVHEREAIRPHVLGRFHDMLRAAVLHPAMLAYLDNDRSTGPNSMVGRRRKKADINENLARELLELHTLGVVGGYTQADIIEIAYALSGWTGRFSGTAGVFEERRHEPGPRSILGRRYPEGGAEQIETILADLARHPSTARHIALKLAHHFVADEAPAALVERLERTFLDSDGDLAAVGLALAEAPEAWTPPPAKIVPPYDFVVSVSRATGLPLEERFLMNALDNLGQRAWYPPSPAGWPDDDGSWIGGDALMERLDWLATYVQRAPLGDDHPADLAGRLLGPNLDDYLKKVLSRAESREQAFALLFMSPYWQRR